VEREESARAADLSREAPALGAPGLGAPCDLLLSRRNPVPGPASHGDPHARVRGRPRAQRHHARAPADEPGRGPLQLVPTLRDVLPLPAREEADPRARAIRSALARRPDPAARARLRRADLRPVAPHPPDRDLRI